MDFRLPVDLDLSSRSKTSEDREYDQIELQLLLSPIIALETFKSAPFRG